MLVIDPDGTPHLPAADTAIRAEDILLAVTDIQNEEALRRALTSPEP
jgi:hypothetical protein